MTVLSILNRLLRFGNPGDQQDPHKSEENRPSADALSPGNYSAVVVTLIRAGVVIWRQGFQPARYFVLAELIPLLLGIFDILSLLGLLPTIPRLRQTTYVGNVLTKLNAANLTEAERYNKKTNS